MAQQPGERGYDAGKKVLGRKRHILTDTMGLILSAIVHSGSIQDRDGAKQLLPTLLNFGRVRTVFADSAYGGVLLDWVKKLIPGRGLKIHIIKRTTKGFKILPKRWVVERTFSWLSPYRRLSKDFEESLSHSQGMIYIASSKIMLKKLRRASLKHTF